MVDWMEYKVNGWLNNMCIVGKLVNLMVDWLVFRDPGQLNLLYEQAKEQILEGTHPVEIEKAITFAAYQVP